jgi:hypothetical protein
MGAAALTCVSTGWKACATKIYSLVPQEQYRFPWNTRNYEKSVGRASAPATAISSWCVERTLRKTLNLEL